jgi:lysophospholipase L1-like esterase
LGALANFDRDVLAVPGVTHVVVFHGANDIDQPGGNVVYGPGPEVDDLIAAFNQLITRAHAHGLEVIGTTVFPMSDIIFQGFYTPEKEPTRQGINDWIRTSVSFDAVLDFDALMRDPAILGRSKQEYITNNGFTLTEAGERVIAESIDLSIFK